MKLISTAREFSSRQAAILGIGVFLLFVAGTMLFVVPWYYLILLCLALCLTALILARFKAGVYISLFLVSANSTFIGVSLQRPWNVDIAGSAMNNIPLVAPFVIVTLISLALSRSAGFRDSIRLAMHPALFVIFAYGLILTVWSRNPMHSFCQNAILVMNIALFVATVNAADDEAEYRRLIRLFLLSGLGITIISLSLDFINYEIEYRYRLTEDLLLKVDILTGSKSPSGEIRRISSLTTTHETGLIMNMMTAVAFGLYLNERRSWRRVASLAMCIGFLAVAMLTMSRGVLIAMLAMGMFFVFMTKTLRKHWIRNGVSVVFTVVAILIIESVALNYLFKSESFEDIRLIKVIGESLKTDEETGKSITDAPGRMQMWRHGFQELSRVSLLGLGPGGFKYLVRAPHAHSVYFSVLFDFGLLGFVLLGFTLLQSGLRVMKTITAQESFARIMSVAVAAGLVASGIHGLVDFEYNTTSLWMFAAISVVTIRRAAEETGAGGPEAGSRG